MFSEAWRRDLVLPVVGLHIAAPTLAHVHSSSPTPSAGARRFHVHYIISNPRNCSIAAPPLASTSASPGFTNNTHSATPWSCNIYCHSDCQTPEAVRHVGGSRARRRRASHSRNTPNGHEKGKYCLTSDEVVKLLFYNQPTVWEVKTSWDCSRTAGCFKTIYIRFLNFDIKCPFLIITAYQMTWI